MQAKVCNTVVPSWKIEMLRYKKPNFFRWPRHACDKLGPVFGIAVNVLKYNRVVSVRPLIESDWTPPVVGGLAPLSAAVLSNLRAKCEKYRQKRVDRLEEDAPKFHAALWATITTESRERIKAH